MEQNTSATLDKIASLSKRRGFVYPTSEIYGGLTSSYDYGPNCCGTSATCGGMR